MTSSPVRAGLLVVSGLVAVGLLGGCGPGSTAVVEGAAAPDTEDSGCSQPAYDPATGTPPPTPGTRTCWGGAPTADPGAGVPAAASDSRSDAARTAPVVTPHPGTNDPHPVEWQGPGEAVSARRSKGGARRWEPGTPGRDVRVVTPRPGMA